MSVVEQQGELDASYNELSHTIIGAAIEVHRALGPGLLENLYEEALCVELGLLKVPFERQLALPMEYKGVMIGAGRLDLLVSRMVVVELKSVEKTLPIHSAQLLSYLRTSGYKLGLLINFNVEYLRFGIERVINSIQSPRTPRLSAPLR